MNAEIEERAGSEDRDQGALKEGDETRKLIWKRMIIKSISGDLDLEVEEGSEIEAFLVRGLVAAEEVAEEEMAAKLEIF